MFSAIVDKTAHRMFFRALTSNLQSWTWIKKMRNHYETFTCECGTIKSNIVTEKENKCCCCWVVPHLCVCICFSVWSLKCRFPTSTDLSWPMNIDNCNHCLIENLQSWAHSEAFSLWKQSSKTLRSWNTFFSIIQQYFRVI